MVKAIVYVSDGVIVLVGVKLANGVYDAVRVGDKVLLGTGVDIFCFIVGVTVKVRDGNGVLVITLGT